MPLNRREVVQLLAATTAWGCGTDVIKVQRMARAARQAAGPDGYAPRFFNPQEWQTVRSLVDLVLPADDRSGSATDAGVPEFMDFIMLEYPDHQGWMRGGLAWLDAESRRRHGALFARATAAQQAAILDDIAFPARAGPAFSHGVAFFNRFRDMTASGFFSSRIGVEDLRYMGNTFVAEWQGCPPEALAKLGVRYD